MTDDKGKGGMKETLSDEFDEAAGKKKDKQGTESSKSGDKGSGGMKDQLSDEFNEAAGENKDDKDS